MTLSDFILLGKKILVGILVAVIPFIILFGGLLLTQKLLMSENDSISKQLLNKPKPGKAYENGKQNP